MQRMNIWASMFCMGNKNNVKPNDIIKLYFDEEETPPITEAEAAELQAMMAAMNRKSKRKTKR